MRPRRYARAADQQLRPRHPAKHFAERRADHQSDPAQGVGVTARRPWPLPPPSPSPASICCPPHHHPHPHPHPPLHPHPGVVATARRPAAAGHTDNRRAGPAAPAARKHNELPSTRPDPTRTPPSPRSCRGRPRGVQGAAVPADLPRGAAALRAVDEARRRRVARRASHKSWGSGRGLTST